MKGLRRYFFFFLLGILLFFAFYSQNSFDHLIVKYAKTYGIDPYLLKGLIRTESSFNPSAVSSVGAIGLCQIMPETGRTMGYSVSDLYNPEKNIEAAARFLSFLYKKASRYWSEPYRTQKVLQGYYAGPGYIPKPQIDISHMVYVNKVLKYYKYYKNNGNLNINVKYRPTKIKYRRFRKIDNKRFIITNYYVGKRKIDPVKSKLYYDSSMVNEYNRIMEENLKELENVRKEAQKEFENIKKEMQKEYRNTKKENENAFKNIGLKVVQNKGRIQIVFNSKEDEEQFNKLSLKEKLELLGEKF